MTTKKKILEKDVEAYLRDEVRSRGGVAHKNISDPRRGGTPGRPDQECVFSWPVLVQVECKAPDTVSRYLVKKRIFEEQGSTKGCSKTEIRQFREQRRLQDLGWWVAVVGTYPEVDELMLKVEQLL